MNFYIYRKPTVKQKTGQPNSSLYKNIAEKEFTKPVKIGLRASGWPSYEVEILIRAKIAGKSIDEIKQLVIQLESLRADILSPSFENKLRKIIDPGLLKDVLPAEVKPEV